MLSRSSIGTCNPGDRDMDEIRECLNHNWSPVFLFNFIWPYLKTCYSSLSAKGSLIDMYGSCEVLIFE